MTFLAVTIGGAMGAVVRYVISLKIQGMKGILLINWVGSFLMGLSLPVVIGTSLLGLFWLVGFLGAFTTFSTFAVQFVESWMNGERRHAGIYALLTLSGGFVLVAAGWWMGSFIS